MLDAYKEQAATRALQCLLSSRASSTGPPSTLSPGTEVLFFFQKAEKNEAIKWNPGTVVSAEPYFVRVKSPSGRNCTITYEDTIKIACDLYRISPLWKVKSKPPSLSPKGGRIHRTSHRPALHHLPQTMLPSEQTESPQGIWPQSQDPCSKSHAWRRLNPPSETSAVIPTPSATSSTPPAKGSAQTYSGPCAAVGTTSAGSRYLAAS